MAYRLGQFECPACGHLELAAPPAVALDNRRGPVSKPNASNWDPGAQYRLSSLPAEAAEPLRGDPAPAQQHETSDDEGNEGSRRSWGMYFLIIGGVGFILPLTGWQFVILSLAGPYEFMAAGAFVVIGIFLLVVPE